jgi:hypothetical protein
MLDMTGESHLLRIDGDTTDAVQALDAGWVQDADLVPGSVTCHTLMRGGVSLLVNEHMQLPGGLNIP